MKLLAILLEDICAFMEPRIFEFLSFDFHCPETMKTIRLYNHAWKRKTEKKFRQSTSIYAPNYETKIDNVLELC